MLECLLYGVLGMSLIVAILAAVSWLDGIKYEQWVRDFEANGGIQWGLGEVLDGNVVVSHTVLGERRTNRG